MARDQHRDVIGAIGGPRRPHRAGSPDRRRDLRIAARLARRDFPQLSPHCFLKRRAGHIERQVRHGRGIVDRSDRASHEIAHGRAAALDGRRREAPDKGCLILIERQAANAFFGCREQHPPQMRLHHFPADGDARSAIAPRAWCHAQPFPGIFIETTRTGIAGIIDRLRDTAPFGQRIFHPSGTERTSICGRGKPHFPSKEPLEMMRRISDLRRQLRERNRAVRFPQQRQRAGHCLPIPPDIIGQAALTGAETGVARSSPAREEPDILPLRSPGRAAWLAINARGPHRDDEAAVLRPVARLERSESRILVQMIYFAHDRHCQSSVMTTN